MKANSKIKESHGITIVTAAMVLVFMILIAGALIVVGMKGNYDRKL
ncbi:MAG: hypothetical protein KDD56_06720 [Bdellovibrionales bacterium]|nr:hypothetical protein [Bdellovibrionales bacterium]